MVELAERRTGVDWIVDWVAASFGAGAITGIALLAPGPLAGLVDPLRAVASRHQVRAPKGGKLQVPLLTLAPAQYAVACQQLLGSLHDGSVAVVDSRGVFESAMKQSRRRIASGGAAFTIARKDDVSEASALVAVALGLYAAKNQGWAAEAVVAADESAADADLAAMQAWYADDDGWE